jgi:hypothetical protein
VKTVIAACPENETEFDLAVETGVRYSFDVNDVHTEQ